MEGTFKKPSYATDPRAKDIFCLPYTKEKSIPIPRKDRRAFLAQTGLNAKISFSPDTTEQEICRIIEDTFGRHFKRPFKYKFLSTMSSNKSKRLHMVESIYPSFKPTGRDLMMLATHGNIYIMALSELQGEIFGNVDYHFGSR